VSEPAIVRRAADGAFSPNPSRCVSSSGRQSEETTAAKITVRPRQHPISGQYGVAFAETTGIVDDVAARAEGVDA
jgi:hypothetical protein